MGEELDCRGDDDETDHGRHDAEDGAERLVEEQDAHEHEGQHGDRDVQAEVDDEVDRPAGCPQHESGRTEVERHRFTGDEASIVKIVLDGISRFGGGHAII